MHADVFVEALQDLQLRVDRLRPEDWSKIHFFSKREFDAEASPIAISLDTSDVFTVFAWFKAEDIKSTSRFHARIHLRRGSDGYEVWVRPTDFSRALIGRKITLAATFSEYSRRSTPVLPGTDAGAANNRIDGLKPGEVVLVTGVSDDGEWLSVEVLRRGWMLNRDFMPSLATGMDVSNRAELTLRSDPRPDATAGSTVAAGTNLQITATIGEWAQVSSVDDPTITPGWVNMCSLA
jgi:hypothetical protein